MGLMMVGAWWVEESCVTFTSGIGFSCFMGLKHISEGV